MNINYWKFFHRSRFLNNLRLPWKNRVALKFFTVLNILFTFRIFNSLRLPWKQSFPEIFHGIEYIFYHSRFLSNVALALENRVAQFIVLNTLLTFRSFEQLALALKNRECPEFTVLNMYFLSFRIFEQLALALTNRVALEFFTVLKIFLHSEFLSNLRLPWKTELPWNFSLYWICIFYHSGFLSNLRLTWKRSLPWNFSNPGGRPPLPTPASYAYGWKCAGVGRERASFLNFLWVRGGFKFCGSGQKISTRAGL